MLTTVEASEIQSDSLGSWTSSSKEKLKCYSSSMVFLENRTDNVVGAVVFFSYIAAALVFTGFIIGIILDLYPKSYNNVGQSKIKSMTATAKRKEKAQIFIALSVISFAALSYQMLSFLIESYTKWWQSFGLFSTGKIISKADSSGSALPRFLGCVWSWSKQSTLFQDFAEAIVNTDARYWWTQQSLLYSMAWNVYMAVEGTRHQIPHLWAFYVLDQILPTSFTQNLFCTSVFLSQNVLSTNSLKPAAPGDQFIVVFIYLLSLSIAPDFLGTKSFFGLVFVIRALLFVPYWMLRPSIIAQTTGASVSMRDLVWKYRYSASVLFVGGVCLHIRQTRLVTSIADAAGAISDNPAVSALGYDYLIGVLSLIIYTIASRI